MLAFYWCESLRAAFMPYILKEYLKIKGLIKILANGSASRVLISLM